MRAKQYIKNLFIFAPLFFSFHWNINLITTLLYVFVLFSLLASSNYIFNDLMDIKEDQLHPTKKFRPIASGAINKKTAITLMLILSSISLSLAWFQNISLFYIFPEQPRVLQAFEPWPY